MSGTRHVLLFLVLLVIFASLISSVHAFGAGNIPSYSHLEGKAFRHGDIDDVLAQIVKKAGGLLGRGTKFSSLDIKRVYFGSWLRDYSQAMDIAALEKTTKQTIMNLITVLSFLAFGYVTQEFEITSERVGVYLCVEHIDNPKGYGEGKNAQQFDPRLRGSVDPRELEVDPRSGMKNYIANESGHWDTSSSFIRRTLIAAIECGRQARRSGDTKQLYEAYRLLGTAMHTLEDFPAHSNWCELALHRLGHRQVFLHVGENVKVRAPDGTMCAPLVTGTFGGSDFMHSMLGEAGDHLSSATVSDLTKSIDQARSSGSNPVGDLVKLLGNVPGGSASSMSRDAEQLSRGPTQDVSTMSPQELHKNLFQILAFRDRIMMSVEETLDKIPGLNSLIEKISNSVSVFVLTLIEPYVQPIIKQAMAGLQMGSAQVINQEDQFEVFNNPNASDPTHSMLSKDHFGLVLNEVGGRVAMIIIKHCVSLVVKAWDDERMDPRQAADECLAAMFHPYWFDRNRCHPVQQEMMGFVEQWASTNPNEIRKLDREHVRSHMNTRSGKAEAHGHGGNDYGGIHVEGQQGLATGTGMAHSVQSYVGGKISGAMGGFGGAGSGMFREVDGSEQVGASQYPHHQSGAPHASSYNTSETYHAPSQYPSHSSHNEGGYGGYGNQSHNTSYDNPSSGYQSSAYPSSNYGAPSTMPMAETAYGGGGGGYNAPDGPPPQNYYGQGPPDANYGPPQGPPPQGYGAPPQYGYQRESGGGYQSGAYQSGGYQSGGYQGGNNY